jgi:hypothetical protein
MEAQVVVGRAFFEAAREKMAEKDCRRAIAVEVCC